MAQGDLARALESYEAGLAVAARLAKEEQSNTGLQDDLSISYNKVGDALKAQGRLAEALQSYRDGLAIREALAKTDPGKSEWQSKLKTSIGKIGNLAYSLVLAQDFAKALEAADQAISLAPDQTWLDGNRAYALMLLGRVDDARALYLKHLGTEQVVGDKSWEQVVLADFAEMRAKGLAHPLMQEIEQAFSQNRTSAVQAVAQPEQATR